MRDIRVASAQFEHTPSDKSANLARVEFFSGAASPPRALRSGRPDWSA